MRGWVAVVDLDQFFQTSKRVRLDFGRIAEVAVGTIQGAIGVGVASVVLGIADIPIALLGGLANFGGDFVAVLAGLPAVLATASWQQTLAFINAAGVAGYVAAVAIVLVTLYIINLGVRRLG